LGNPSTGLPLPPFTCRPRTATRPLSTNFSAGCCGCLLGTGFGTGLEERRAKEEEEEDWKGREEVGRGLLLGLGLVGPRRSSCERAGAGRGLDTS
jgi:hypothetical protein